MEALIVAVILAYAVKKAAESAHLHWQGAKAANRASTRGQPPARRAASAVQHDAGYWAHQALNLFPQVRGGLADGWHAGRTAQQQGRARRAQARTGHLEERARLIPELREHRRRQAEALEKIRAARRRAEAGSEGSPAFPVLLTARSRSGKPVSPFTSAPQDTIAVYDRDDLDRRLKAAEADPDIEVATRPAPGLAAPAGGPSWQEGPATTPTEGTSMSDVTYDTLLRRTAKAVAAAEERAAQQAAEKARDDQTADQMQALEVDAATLSAMSDYLDALDRAEKAQQAVIEAARNVEAALKRGHEGLSEAHKDAPVAAAQRDFYAD